MGKKHIIDYDTQYKCVIFIVTIIGCYFKKKQHEALLINNTTLCETWAKFPHKNRKDKNN